MKNSTMRRIAGWSVHLYTALGMVLGAVIAVLIVQGGEERFRLAFLLMLVATFVDATDGWLARRARVKEVIPEFDGRRLDDIIDYQTYTSLPLLLVWRAELLPSEWAAWLLVPLLASIYGFCQTEAKTDDGFFLGFPSYWNIVALYLFLLRPPGAIALGVVLLLAVLTFVPLKYPYPSQPGRVNLWATILALPWAILLITALLGIAPDPRQWALLSLFYPALYLASALVISSRGSR